MGEAAPMPAVVSHHPLLSWEKDASLGYGASTVTFVVTEFAIKHALMERWQEKLSHRDKMSESISLQIYNVFRNRTDDLLAQPNICTSPIVIQPCKPIANLAVFSSRDRWQTVCSQAQSNPSDRRAAVREMTSITMSESWFYLIEIWLCSLLPRP